jgi:NitT/TauT family transport system ATP-binding protein
VPFPARFWSRWSGPFGLRQVDLLQDPAGLHATTAEVRIGTPAHPFDPARDVGMVFQAPLLLKWRRILSNVLLPAEISACRRRVARAGQRALCAWSGSRATRTIPYELSGGMQQRAAIARALCTIRSSC